MLRLPVIVVGALLVSAGAATAGGDASGTGWRVSETGYRCADGTAVELTYLFHDQQPGLAVMGFRGQQVAMRQVRSGSGVRFAALDEQAGLRWHVKGAVGFVAMLAADHTATMQVLADDCRETQSRAYHLPR